MNHLRTVLCRGRNRVESRKTFEEGFSSQTSASRFTFCWPTRSRLPLVDAKAPSPPVPGVSGDLRALGQTGI